MILSFPSQNSKARTAKILVVDDEKVIADTLQLILSAQGYEVKTFYRATTAIESLNSFTPDLVIGDLFLPDGYGFDLAASIKQRSPQTKVLLLSGQVATIELLDEAKAAGVELLSKPIGPKELIRKVQDMLAASQGTNAA